MAIPQLGSKNLNTSTILCDVYNGLNSVTPLALAGEEKDIGAGISWALDKLAGAGLSDTALGCPKNSLSPDFQLFPNRTQLGGPLNEPEFVFHNTGDNVFYKTYFATAPTTPQCSPTL